MNKGHLFVVSAFLLVILYFVGRSIFLFIKENRRRHPKWWMEGVTNIEIFLVGLEYETCDGMRFKVLKIDLKKHRIYAELI